MKTLIHVSSSIVACCFLASPRSARSGDREATPPRLAVPLEPVGAILQAFGSHALVALGEGTHDNEQGHVLRLKLIRDPRFAATVDDLVVEFGNARYQGLMDRFVRGEDVPYESLRRVWQDTTQPDALWDTPPYEELFRAVRSVNASLPDQRRLRVLLGDPPIDWDAVHTAQDYGTWDRDGHAADLIKREVLAKGRKALVVYGDSHFMRKNPRPRDPADDTAYSIVTLLEKDAAIRPFTIRTIAYGIDLDKLQPDVVAWPRPSLALLPGTLLGVASFSSYYPRPLVVRPDGTPVETPEERRPLRMEQQFDALLYLGPQSTITRAQLPAKLCSDPAYMRMRLGRMEPLGLQPGIERLKQACAASRRRG